MDLELELTDRKHVVLGVCAEERRECVKLPALDVDLEDIDEGVSLGVLSISISVTEERRNTRVTCAHR